jgi:hypothetical protein
LKTSGLKLKPRTTKDHTPGKIRYFTYYLIFPHGDKDVWCAQIPFVHDLQFELKQTAWRNDPNKCHDLLKKGETTWVDHNSVRHRIVIEDVKRPKKWGINSSASIPA